MSDFLPASAASSKARKTALKSAASSTNKKATSAAAAAAKSKTQGKGKGKSTLISTQPSHVEHDTGADTTMDDIERLPLDSRTEQQKKLAAEKLQQARAGLAASSTQDAQAAMDMDQNAASDDDDDDAVMIDPSTLSAPTPVTRTPIAQVEANEDPSSLVFPAVSHSAHINLTQRRKVSIPPHRMTPLKRDWIKIYTPLVEECGLQVRMNVHKKWIEMKTSKHTPGPSSLTRAVDFLTAYTLGFSVEDAIAMLRLEELYIETFEIHDVKRLHGDHLSRAIGRLAGHDGKTRFVIENCSRTRIVLADTKIHILGTYANIAIARNAISALILGSPPGKVYNNLRRVAARGRERF